MQTIQDLYTQFLGYFPNFLHPVISLVLVIFLVYSIFQVLKKNFIYLILLVVLLPAAIPIIKQIFATILTVIRYLLP